MASILGGAGRGGPALTALVMASHGSRGSLGKRQEHRVSDIQWPGTERARPIAWPPPQLPPSLTETHVYLYAAAPVPCWVWR